MGPLSYSVIILILKTNMNFYTKKGTCLVIWAWGFPLPRKGRSYWCSACWKGNIQLSLGDCTKENAERPSLCSAVRQHTDNLGQGRGIFCLSKELAKTGKEDLNEFFAHQTKPAIQSRGSKVLIQCARQSPLHYCFNLSPFVPPGEQRRWV